MREMKEADLLLQKGRLICLFWHQNGALPMEGGYEFYELSYWIWQCSKVLKYPTGYQEGAHIVGW
jgi:hypothetical protein